MSGPKMSELYHGREYVVCGQIYTKWQKLTAVTNIISVFMGCYFYQCDKTVGVY